MSAKSELGQTDFIEIRKINNQREGGGCWYESLNLAVITNGRICQNYVTSAKFKNFKVSDMYTLAES